jgi:hypothetical protein
MLFLHDVIVGCLGLCSMLSLCYVWYDVCSIMLSLLLGLGLF